jgi:hypothetical protein
MPIYRILSITLVTFVICAGAMLTAYTQIYVKSRKRLYLIRGFVRKRVGKMFSYLITTPSHAYEP